MLDNGIDFEVQKELLIQQIREKGVRDEQVLDAIRRVPRHLMVPEEYRWQAYIDHALPIGEGQTISQPSLVATMTELLELKGDERVLEIGTGSGYQAAILTLLCRQLVTMERYPRLALRAYQILTALRFPPFVLVMGDGTRGFPPLAPYDRILVTAGAPGRVPPPLLEQLSPHDGRLLLPLGSRTHQVLTLIIKRGARLFTRTYGECVFVPLIGEYGWQPDEAM
ncbi:MAG: protein-L-isoaspartate(D-aspartate) O-methyltransferase, partial [Fimbriimonadales bacterium]|nr:protein-L-isoaspartate(D-aspartate) O-methyltransferase [Fimbriimonadales bacterium]